MPKKKEVLFFVFIYLISINLFSQEDSSAVKKFIQKTEFSGKWYLAYRFNISENTNNFALKRGYITFKTNLNEQISVRYTQDITIDREGSDAGNVEIRIKYIYLKYNPFKIGKLKETTLGFGLVHRPYVDFEQHINDYRSQGRMFIEKTGIVNTAGFGINYTGMFGGKLSSDIPQREDTDTPGKYGSFAIGIYNGGGYHNIEKNENKTLEARFTLRPFPYNLTGFQITYAGIYGKGNNINSPDFYMNLGALTYENHNYILTAQYYDGKGDYNGFFFDENGLAAKNNGFSFFGEYKIPKTSFALFGRYDRFNSNQISDFYKEGFFGGITYRFLKSKIFVYYGKDYFSNEAKDYFELVLDVNF